MGWEMTMLTLRPVPNRPSVFDAMLDGERIVRSRQPYFAGARALLARGCDPDTPLHYRFEGSAIVSGACTIGEAAKWTVQDSDHRGMRRVEFVPFDRQFLSTRIDQFRAVAGEDDAEVTEDAA